MKRILKLLLLVVLLAMGFQSNAKNIFCDVTVISNESNAQSDDGKAKGEEEEEEEEEPDCD